ncbi:MAG: four-carbon acid sugar kinase family protein [Pirellulaceae bacterium]|nr:four-carbon acid sugar kinase family protein [Pirellulaceae bacterium]
MKIVVIADDLTGAAEVAGSALRYGLSAEVQIGQLAASEVDVIVVDADSRSQSPEIAFDKVLQLTQQAVDAQYGLLYKKVDSLLRGPVLAELAAMREATGLDRCLLVCGNPRKRRNVIQGKIAIDGQPLHQTEFALDPEHPRHTDDVIGLLQSGSSESTLGCSMAGAESLSVLAPGRAINTPIAVGDVACTADLDRHVQQWLDQRDTTLVAGGAEFFEAILRGIGVAEHLGIQREAAVVPGNQALKENYAKALLVSGTRLSHCEGWPVMAFPPDRSLAECVGVVRQALETEGRAAIRAVDLVSGSHVTRLQWITQLAAQILGTCELNQVWIEGGRTASSLLRELCIMRLKAIAELGDGVVCLTACGSDNPLFLIKPGSYPWPPAALNTPFAIRNSHIQ